MPDARDELRLFEVQAGPQVSLGGRDPVASHELAAFEPPGFLVHGVERVRDFPIAFAGFRVPDHDEGVVRDVGQPSDLVNRRKPVPPWSGRWGVQRRAVLVGITVIAAVATSFGAMRLVACSSTGTVLAPVVLRR